MLAAAGPTDATGNTSMTSYSVSGGYLHILSFSDTDAGTTSVDLVFMN
jgi:hypothetical protein